MQLHIIDLTVPVSLGVYAWEKRWRRRVLISLTIDYAPGPGDALADTLDYDALTQAVREVAQAKHYELIETMLRAVGAAVLAFPMVGAVRVDIAKPGALPGARLVRISEKFGQA